MITSVVHFIRAIERDLKAWPANGTPWFRGESGTGAPLTPKIADLHPDEELYLLQTFRRKAGGLSNTPHRQGETDLWLFLAQHYGVKTRLLDWTEGALIALFFAVNRGDSNPRVYMLNPHRLNNLCGIDIDPPNFPLTWGEGERGIPQIKSAWASADRRPATEPELPVAIPATYQDHRMIAQRSCFTVHGKSLSGLDVLLAKTAKNPSDYLVTYRISAKASAKIMRQLFYLGVSASSIFPDLENLAKDLNYEVAQ